MESIAPPLLLIEFVLSAVENGNSVRSGVKLYLQNTDELVFSRHVARWLFAFEQNLDRHALINQLPSPYRRATLTILEQGLKGMPIHERLEELKSDIVIAAQLEMDAFISTLPLKLLLPVLLLMFPSFLVLLLGPLITNFLRTLN